LLSLWEIAYYSCYCKFQSRVIPLLNQSPRREDVLLSGGVAAHILSSEVDGIDWSASRLGASGSPVKVKMFLCVF
jgi:hypothetical protein